MRNFLLISLAIFTIVACQKEPGSNWNDLDLLDKGFPITIKAPDSAQVKVVDNMGILHDITVDSNEDNYHIQIYASDASTDDLAVIKAELISDVRDNRYFSRIVEEDEKGFIYETMIDSTNYYGFRQIHVLGNTEFIFQSGISYIFTLEEIRILKQAVVQSE